MKSGERRYIWEAANWPNWRYDLAALAGPLSEANRSQGILWPPGRLAAWPTWAWHCAIKPACWR